MEPGFTVVYDFLTVDLIIFIRIGHEIGCIQQIYDRFIGHTDEKW